MTRELTAATEHAGVRLDAFLSADGALTRSQAARLIAEGRLAAVRIGGRWAIDSDTQPPPDARVKSGKYRDWRKKPAGEPEQ